jgi:glycerophosphoryl diester phosphodiesterase
VQLITQQFELHGHRGACGLKPENTLPSFEAAIDAGVSAIETDIHLSRDGIPVLIHDAFISPPIFAAGESVGPLRLPVLISALELKLIRQFRAKGNRNPVQFAEQDAAATPLAELVAGKQGIDPYAPPTLLDLFALAEAYAGELGRKAGKTAAQRDRAQRVYFDLELKRVPGHPEFINDGFDGITPGFLEQQVVETARSCGIVERVRIRSFDHRAILALRQLDPCLKTGILVGAATPVSIVQLARSASSQFYYPQHLYVDERQIEQAHEAGIAVIPWTVNDLHDLSRMLSWGVDGITTDYPSRVAKWLAERGISWR